MVWSRKIQQEIRVNRFKGGALLCLAVFLSLSFLSYNSQDPSLNSFGLSLKVTNYCGFIGAILADLFYQLFGLSAWFFVFGLIFYAYKFFSNRFQESLLSSLLLFSLFLISFSSLSSLHFGHLSFFEGKISLGGAMGHVLILILKPLFHVTGTAVLLWSVLFLVGLFYGQSLFLPSLWKHLAKAFIFGLHIIKKWPVAFDFLSLKAKGFFQFTKKSLQFVIRFMKKLFLMMKKRAGKISKVYTLKKTQKVPLEKKPVKKIDPPEKAQFVFKEKDFTEPKELSFKEEVKESDIEKSGSGVEKRASGIEKRPKSADKISLPSSPPPSQWRGASLPSLDLLSSAPSATKKINQQDVDDLSKKLIDKLSQFSIEGEITAVKTGPALVLFEFKPEKHIKVSRIREMESDLSMALSSESIRIIAPIPGRDVVGIEASMPYREMVYLKNLLREDIFSKLSLPLVLGRRADNVIGIKDLARIPHLLVAGTTGSGKSMFIISFISSLLFRHTPETLRLLLIDPKQVDLSEFKDIPHLLSPIITSSNKAVGALNWACMEMEKRYRSLSQFKARDHQSFNSLVQNLSAKEKKFHKENNEASSAVESYYFEALPLITIVIEEFGDLMADRNVRRNIENAVVRLAQKARASGIHLVLAMQSPRKDVVTGLIKTNIPGRISFKVASGTDSRVILDDTGAERLLSHGDMLFLEPGSLKPVRYHGPFLREKDIREIGNYWKAQGKPSYAEELVKQNNEKNSLEINSSAGDIKEDPMYDEILEFIKNCDMVSASFLQRKFRIGYPRAARMIEVLFEEGQIGPPQGSKPREVLINK